MSNFSEAWLFIWCLFCTVWSLLSMAVFYCIARDKKSLFLIIHEFAITASTTVTKFMVEKFNSMHLLLAVLAWFWIRFYESNLVVINCRKLIEITAVPHEFLHGGKVLFANQECDPTILSVWSVIQYKLSNALLASII